MSAQQEQTAAPPEFDAEGYDRRGYDWEGYDRAGYNQYGFNQGGFNQDGYDQDGFTAEGYNRHGYGRDGFTAEGFDTYGYGRDGYNSAGYDTYGYGRDGYNSAGYDRSERDREGYNSQGLNRQGYDREGYAYDGYNQQDCNRDGQPRWDADGFSPDGYSRADCGDDYCENHSYDRSGYTRSGYDRDGYDRPGYTRSGYDRDGYGRSGYDREGYNRQGLNERGQPHWDDDGYNPQGYSRDGFGRDGYDSRGYNTSGYDRSGFDSSGYNADGFSQRGRPRRHVNYDPSYGQYRLLGYSYQPPWQFHGNGPAFYGMELEITADNDQEDLEIAVSGIGNLGFLKSDSSITGFEMVTHPMSYDWAMTNFPWNLLGTLSGQGCDTDPDENGLHIHVSRNAFGSQSHLFRWMKFLYRNAGDCQRIGRRNSRGWGTFSDGYARKDQVVHAKKFKNPFEHDGDGTQANRYSAVNTQNEATLEVRFIASTLDENEARQALQLVAGSVEYTRQLQARDVCTGNGWEWGAFAAWLSAQGNTYGALARSEAKAADGWRAQQNTTARFTQKAQVA